MSGLSDDLVDENQQMLAHVILMTMSFNSFNVDGVKINFIKEEESQ